MHAFNVQPQKTIVRLIGWLIVPAMILIPLILYGKDRNVTGLLEYSWAWIISFFLMFWFLFLLSRNIDRLKHGRVKLVLLFLMITASLCVPYTVKESTVSSLHLLLSYGSLVLMNLILFEKYWLYEKYRNIYLVVSLLCVLHSCMSLQVTMFSEAVYACMLDILLTKKETE